MKSMKWNNSDNKCNEQCEAINTHAGLDADSHAIFRFHAYSIIQIRFVVSCPLLLDSIWQQIFGMRHTLLGYPTDLLHDLTISRHSITDHSNKCWCSPVVCVLET
jgi:hypothetical protein